MKRIWILALLLVVALAVTVACTKEDVVVDDGNTNGDLVVIDIDDANGDENDNGYANGNGGNDIDLPVDPVECEDCEDDELCEECADNDTENGTNGYDNGNGSETPPEEGEGLAKVVPSPGGQAARVTYDLNWGSLQIPHTFTSGQYTATVLVNHPSQSVGDTFGIMPVNSNVIMGSESWSFINDEFEEISYFDITPGVWNELEVTFSGSQANQTGSGGDPGLMFAGGFPRVEGSHFYIANIVVTNSAGEKVIDIDFANGVGSAKPSPWDSATVTVVPAP
jgi:hypothetical protein